MKKSSIIKTGVLMALVFSIAGCKSEENTKDKVLKTEEVNLEKSEFGNPILGFNNIGAVTYSGDPAAFVEGDTVYLYTGHDTASNESYVIPEWQCYTSKDMINWNYEGVVMKCSDITWASDKNSAWASQAVSHNGKYYLYYCSWDKTASGKQSIGVAVSDSPTSGFKDIGTPLVKGTVTANESSTWNDIDPTVWVEKDASGIEHRYIMWGNGKLYVAELNEDMISIKDIDGDGVINFGKDVIEKKAPEKFTEAPWIYRQKDASGNYTGKYYLFYAYGWREQMAYATTDDLMNGEFEFGAVIMEPTATSNTNHMSVIDFSGKTYFIYHNGSLEGGSGFRRVACVEEFKINEDGTINYINETATGISGKKSTITDLSKNAISHYPFKNSESDSSYPYVKIVVGSNISNATKEDGLWEIVPGKLDKTNETYVSIESYNKPGLYLTVVGEDVRLAQDNTGVRAVSQTFRTVKGLSGKGVSFESLSFEGKYITIVDGNLKITDGKDKKNSSFLVEEAK
jgi:hypothetical protein